MVSWRPPRRPVTLAFPPPRLSLRFPSSRSFPASKVKATRSNSRGCSRAPLAYEDSSSCILHQNCISNCSFLGYCQLERIPFSVSLSFSLTLSRLSRSSFNPHSSLALSLVSFRLFSYIYFTYVSEHTHVTVRIRVYTAYSRPGTSRPSIILVSGVLSIFRYANPKWWAH